MSAVGTQITPLGDYLRDRRMKLDPAALGFSLKRRRTPGLRREEVAQRANVSATWYTWLEQGRGGAPSADVLDRISRALMLTDVEREHLFLIGLGHPPDVRFREIEGISPRLQRVLDALPLSPAIVKNATWDVLAWNAAATALFTDYSDLPPEKRNILRLMFTSERTINAQTHWEHIARYVVAVFRADVARAGASERSKALIAELSAQSPVFAKLWQSNDVQTHGEGTKHLHTPSGGIVALEFSTFAVDGRPDLGMMVYNPATPEDAKIIADLIKADAKKKRSAK